MARKRKRALRWAGLLVLVAILHIAAGILFSPLTALRRIRLEVAGTGIDATAMSERLDTLRGRPWALVGGALPRSLVSKDPWVSDVSWTSNPFGFGVAKVKVRKPVAVLDKRDGRVLLTADGMWLSGTPSAGLTVVRTPARSLAASGGIASLSDGPRLADWVVRVVRHFPEAREVELEDSGVLSLRREDGVWIVFGSWERLDDKLRRAKDVLATGKPVAGDVLNVTVPENAVWSKRAEEK